MTILQTPIRMLFVLHCEIIKNIRLLRQKYKKYNVE